MSDRASYSFSVLLALWVLTASVSAQKPELYLSTGHTGPIYSVAYSPDGRVIASASEDTTVKLWDATSRREIQTLRGHTGRVMSVVFSPDGKFVASGGDDGLIVVWESATGARVLSLDNQVPVAAVAFSPNGHYLASWSSEIRILEVPTWKEILRIHGNEKIAKMMQLAKGQVRTPLAFSPDSTLLAASSLSSVKLYDVRTGKSVRSFDHLDAASIAISPNGKILAADDIDFRLEGDAPNQKVINYGVVILSNIATGKRIGTLSGHTDRINALAFSPDGTILASCGYDKTVRLWNIAQLREIRTLAGSPEWVNSVAFSLDGRTLATATGSITTTSSAENSIRLWDVDTGVAISTFGGLGRRVLGLDVSADGRIVVQLTNDASRSTIHIWDLAQGKKARTLTVPYWLYAIALSPDGRYWAAGSSDHTVTLWDVDTGQLLRTFLGHSDVVFSIAFSKDGKFLASGSADKTVKIWDVATGREIRTLLGHTQDVLSVAFSPDGKLMASTGLDRTARVWEVATGTQLSNLIDPSRGLVVTKLIPQTNMLDKLWGLEVNQGGVVAFSPDGKSVAVAIGGYAGAAPIHNENQVAKLQDEIRLFDLATGAERMRLLGHQDSILSLSFSDDGQKLVSASADKTINIWDLRSGNKLKTWSDTLDYDAHAVFIPHTDLVAGASGSLLHLWGADSGSLFCTMTSVENSNEWLAVTPDGLFDGSPAAWQQLLWRFGDKSTDVLPVESYFSDFFYPDLIQDLFAGQHPKAQAQIENRDRRQPTLTIALPTVSGGTTSDRTVAVRLEVHEAPADHDHATGSGVRDVRLFRNGSLVRVWHGDVLASGQNQTVLETSLPVVAGINVLTAYAFNRDNVKSLDATAQVTGAESLRRRGTAYIISIGLNAYANPQFNLKFAVPDAQAFGDEIRRQQAKLGVYDHIEVISLVDGEATKANILLALDRLAGHSVPAGPRMPEWTNRLQPVQPEDTIFIYFSGHGTAQQNQFYLIPHDLGYAGTRAELNNDGLQQILAHSISDRELQQAFERLDAGQILLVIDACNSGQALEAEEKRRGPMNSKGLAQLAYEKGMYILTAAQGYQSALESARLGHGFLTYALVEEGLHNGKADADPRDGRINAREWLDFATARVPELQQETPVAESGRTPPPATPARTPATRTGPRNGARTKRQLVQGVSTAATPGLVGDRDMQRPRLFYRRELGQPLIIAQP